VQDSLSRDVVTLFGYDALTRLIGNVYTLAEAEVGGIANAACVVSPAPLACTRRGTCQQASRRLTRPCPAWCSVHERAASGLPAARCQVLLPQAAWARRTGRCGVVCSGVQGPTYSLEINGGTCEIFRNGTVECEQPSVTFTFTPLTCNGPYKEACAVTVSAWPRMRGCCAPAAAQAGEPAANLSTQALLLHHTAGMCGVSARRCCCCTGEGESSCPCLPRLQGAQFQIVQEFGSEREGTVGPDAGVYNFGVSQVSPRVQSASTDGRRQPAPVMQCRRAIAFTGVRHMVPVTCAASLTLLPACACRTSPTCSWASVPTCCAWSTTLVP